MGVDISKTSEAELAMMALLLTDSAIMDKYYDQLSPDDFRDDFLKELLTTMKTMRLHKKPIDMVTVVSENPKLDASRVVELGTKFALAVSADVYLRKIKDIAARRKLFLLGRDIQRSSINDELSVEQQIQSIRESQMGIVGSDVEDTGSKDIVLKTHEILFEQLDDGRIFSGINKLDDLIVGFKPERLYVLGARPSIGKSAFAMIMAINAARQKKRVLYINREMGKTDLMKRQIANIARIDMGALERNDVNADETLRIMESYAEINELDINIANSPSTVAEIRATLSRVTSNQHVDLLIIDYLQRIKSEKERRNRLEEVGEISASIKNMAMDYKIPIILLSQLNRSAANARPNMSMLRESGDIEQDADVVLLLHQPDDEEIPKSRKADSQSCIGINGVYTEVIVEKNRHGPKGIFPVAFVGQYMRLYNLPLKMGEKR